MKRTQPTTSQLISRDSLVAEATRERRSNAAKLAWKKRKYKDKLWSELKGKGSRI